MLSLLKLFQRLAILLVFGGTQLLAHSDSNLLSCSAHFQARANWLQTYGADPEAVEFMAARAEVLWLSLPRDCGMKTGFEAPDCTYDPRRKSVTDIMTKWAGEKQFNQVIPTCMEDSFCSHCLAVYQDLTH